MLLQEFKVKIKDKKGSKNLVTDHLSKLEITDEEQREINKFPDEKILSINSLTLISFVSEIPWFADYVNFLIGDFLPKDLTY